VSRHGGNGFLAVSGQHAAVRLAQGAGRLIRSIDDRGVVAVLDSRLVTKSYGGFLRSSLPPLWGTGDKKTILAALGRLSA
jgi:ATP-dependent DNA helicase DinG